MLILSKDLISIYQSPLYVHNSTILPLALTNAPESKIMVYIDINEKEAGNLQFVEKILGACKILPSQYQLYAIQAPKIEAVALFKHHKPEILISFGIPFANEILNLHSRNNDITNFLNSKILITNTLGNLQKTASEKSALWVSLQKIFNLN